MPTDRYSLPLCHADGSFSPERFAVRRIVCIGRNYAEHAREMGHDPQREAPFFFFKPVTALAQNGVDFCYPHFSEQVDYELELVIALGQPAHAITREQAADCVLGFAVGLDMTCRDLQKQAKQLGRPWELAKGFDGSAPCTAIQLGSLTDLAQYGALVLTRNGEEVQRGDWRSMIWSVPELIAEVSRFISLDAGDLIFTGTPAGIGPVVRGDRLRGTLEGFAQELHLCVV